MKLTNTQAQKIYHLASDAIYECKEDSLILLEMGKIIADDPYKNEKFAPIVNEDVIGFWLHNEISSYIDFYETEMSSKDVNRCECTAQEMSSMIALEAKTEKYYTDVRKRVKILCLLALELEIWEDKMQELVEAIDNNHPEALTALSFYEDAIISTFNEEVEIKLIA